MEPARPEGCAARLIRKPLDRTPRGLMTDSHTKGSALEVAVHAIESAILQTFPAYSEKTFHIESRKIIVSDGVKHEIDIWVKVDHGAGYDATFIFECRNWQDKISKNDIIVFSEKIRSSNAQKGYFVARSYTKDAVAQAEKDPRILLLRVKDLPSDGVPIPFGFHGINLEGAAADVRLSLRKTRGAHSQPAVVNPAAAHLVLDGQLVDWGKYVNEWVLAEAERRSNQFPSASATEGVHELQYEATRTFGNGRAILNGDELLSISILGKANVRVVKAKVMSHFEVETRGRVLTLALDFPLANLHVSFPEIPDDPGSGPRAV